MKNPLLKNIFYGSEIDKLDVGTQNVRSMLGKIPEFKTISYERWNFLLTITKDFFSKSLKGMFGGPITAGDAFFILTFMEAVRPQVMVEVGVCSGVSSCFILYAAERLNLVQSGKIFLYSFDLLRYHDKEQKDEIGVTVKLNYPELIQFWDLYIETTLIDLLFNNKKLYSKIFKNTKILAFVDANHYHPYPTIDTMILKYLMAENSWCLLQDTNVIERWAYDAIEKNTVMPYSCRGVNLVSTLWPGKKIIGTDMCYNMAALNFNIEYKKYKDFIHNISQYIFEDYKDDLDINFLKLKIFMDIQNPVGYLDYIYKVLKKNLRKIKN
jgi:hypothetical protein